MRTFFAQKSILHSIGFDDNETTVFLYLVHQGASNVTAIAKKTKLSRGAVYKTLSLLLEKKRARTTSSKKRVLYEAIDPSTLVSEVEEATKRGIQNLYQLSAKHKASLFVPVTSMYEGQEEIHSIYEDIIKTLPKGGTYFRYTSRKDSYEKTPLYQTYKNIKEIERLVITSEQKALSKEKDSNRFIKTVPKDFAFEDNVTLLIYGSKVAYIDYTSMTGTVIESPQLARFQEKIFKLLWKKL